MIKIQPCILLHSKFSFTINGSSLCKPYFSLQKWSVSAYEEQEREPWRRGHRILVVSSCQNNEPIERSTSNSNTKKEEKEKEKEKEKRQVLFSEVFSGVQKLGRGLKENMSPKQKGDWKDVMLMSLSFAVYVYMSQMLVCAYCSWTSMPKPSW